MLLHTQISGGEEDMQSVYPLKYVVKRNNVFYYRRRIPPILQSYFGKPVFMVSLRTSDLSSAKQASFRYDQKIQHLLALTVMNYMAKIPTSNPYSMQLIIRFSTHADGRVVKTTELTPDDLRIFHEMGMDTDKVSEFVTKLHMNSKTADESIIHRDTLSDRESMHSSAPSSSNPLGLTYPLNLHRAGMLHAV